MNTVLKFSITLAVFTFIAYQSLVTGTAHALPAFSRTYKVECTTCHSIFPELNEYGEAFLKNSYVYFGKAKKSERKESTLPPPLVAKKQDAVVKSKISGSGDDDKLAKLKSGAMLPLESETSAGEPVQQSAAQPAPIGGEQVVPEGLLLAGIPELLPISFTASLHATHNPKAVNELDFSTRAFKLNAGGNFREKAAFFATYTIYTENAAGITNTSQTPTNATSKNDINEFYLIGRQLFDTPINVKVGRMQPKLGLWKSNNKLSTTHSYLPYNYRVGDKSEFQIDQPQDAIELNATLFKRFFAAAGVVNRKGQNSKDWYGHVSYKFGGADYLANEPDVDLSKDESISDFLVITTGAYGYYGKNGVSNSNDSKNTYFRAGFDAEALYKNFRLRLLAGIGEDDNALLIASPWTKVISKAVSFENEVTVLVNLIAAARFEYLQQESATNSFSTYYSRKYIGTLSYAPLENFKILAEYNYQVDPKNIERIATLGATFSF
jgi:hypothetical protein